MLELDGRNQSNQARVYEEKTLRTYILPETKLRIFFAKIWWISICFISIASALSGITLLVEV